MPIEDQFADDLLDRPPTYTPVPGEAEGGSSGAAAAAAAAAAPIPFADTGNPVMAQLAFLSHVVGFRGAGAAVYHWGESCTQQLPAPARG
jgi:hypothetical protein